MTNSIEQLLQAHNIDLADTNPGQHDTTCPQCSHTRKKDNTKCLGVKIDGKGACWKCNHCGWAGPTKGNGRAGSFVTYEYSDANGTPVRRKLRYGKDHKPPFSWQCPDGLGGWTKGGGDAPRVLYRLPEVLAAIKDGKTIVVVEGEKDADNLWRIDVPATSSPNGAADPTKDQKPKWEVKDSEHLRGADIVVLGDNDPPGYDHQDATALLSQGIARRVRVLKLAEHWPECPKGGDVSDWLDAGHTADELWALVEKTPNFVPPEQNKPGSPEDGGQHARQTGKVKVRLEDLTKSVADLQTMTFDPLCYAVPDYIVEGLTLFAGRPKIGKSWLALGASISVAQGGMFLERQCEEGDVLALFLEDTSRRLQRRITTMLGAQKADWPTRLTYATEWPRLEEGGLDLIRQWIAKVPKAKLIVIDILERVRHRSKQPQQGSQYSDDYQALVTLQKLSAEAQVPIFVLHHQRKQGGEDLVDTISGTLGLGGAVDAFVILGKDGVGHYLYGRGRDLEEFRIAVKMDACSRWLNLGPQQEMPSTPERAAIIKVLAEAGRPMRIDEITTAVGGTKDNIKNLLSKMHFAGEVERVATGLYKLPNPQAELDVGDVGI